MYLADTNVISELRKYRSGRMHPSARHWVEHVDVNDVYISVISMMEIRTGILRRARKDAAQAQILQQWFSHELAPEFAGRILPVSLEVALTCSELHVPHKKSEYDALIGATAREHHLMLVTRNVADFQGMGLDILNPFEFHV